MFSYFFEYLDIWEMDHKPQKEGIEELMCLLLVRPNILLEFILVTGNRNCVIWVAGRKHEEFSLTWEGQLVREVGDFLLSVLIVQKNYLGILSLTSSLVPRFQMKLESDQWWVPLK